MIEDRFNQWQKKRWRIKVLHWIAKTLQIYAKVAGLPVGKRKRVEILHELNTLNISTSYQENSTIL